MYEIYKKSEVLYQIHSSLPGFAAKELSLTALIVYANKVGIIPGEVEEALVSMLQKDHDTAHFGIMKTFIYSFNKSEKYGKVS